MDKDEHRENGYKKEENEEVEYKLSAKARWL